MSNENALTIIPRTIGEVQTLAEMLKSSTLLPKALTGNVANIAMQVMAGQELGLAPMTSIRTIHVIEGKPVLSADGMVAVALGSGKAKYFKRIAASDTSVTYETHRVGDDEPQKCTWTIEDAKRAALDKKENWRGYPRAMLASRAKSELARDVYPDVLAGCYSDDEARDGSLGTIPRERPPAANTNADAVDAEIVSETTGEAKLSEADALQLIADSVNADALEALKASFAIFKGDSRKRVRAAFDAREIVLKSEQAA